VSTRPIEGDLWAPSASEARRYARVADEYERAAHRLGVTAAAPPRGPGVLRVRNDSGAAVDRFAILGIDTTVPIDPADYEDQFLSSPLLAGVTPAQADHDGKFAVTMHAGGVDELIWCVLSGLAVCQVNVAEGEEWYEFADVLDADATKLTALPAGAAHVLWRQTGSGDKWAVVRVGNPPGLVYCDYQLKADLPGGSSAAAYVMRNGSTYGSYEITLYAPPSFAAGAGTLASGSQGTAAWDRWDRHWRGLQGSCALAQES
jgi:hypothetical protein